MTDVTGIWKKGTIINPQAQKFAPFLNKGDVVVIPKGVTIRSTQSSNRTKIAGRNLTVTVDHMIPPVSTPLIEVSRRHDGGAGSEFIENVNKAINENDNEFAFTHLIITTEPTVRWAGTGGYWNEVPLSEVIIKEMALAA